ncbi:hypothetical protein ACSBR1_007479 [Camellia fascicularis]
MQELQRSLLKMTMEEGGWWQRNLGNFENYEREEEKTLSLYSSTPPPLPRRQSRCPLCANTSSVTSSHPCHPFSSFVAAAAKGHSNLQILRRPSSTLLLSRSADLPSSCTTKSAITKVRP